MLLKADSAVVKKLKQHDKKLSVKWNNKDKCWEIWVKRPKGNMLLTPIVESIYNIEGSCYKFEPLDNRIVEWVKSADSQKKTLKRGWKWLRKKAYKEIREKKQLERKMQYHQMARDNFNLIRSNDRNSITDFGEDYLLPDVQNLSCGRLSHRSAENLKRYRGEE